MGLAAGDVVLVQFRGQCFGQQILCNRTLSCSASFPALNRVIDDLALIANDIGVGAPNNQTTAYLNCLPPQYQLDSIRVQKLNAPRSVAFDLSTPGTNGTNMSVASVANDSAALTFRTTLAGRDQVSTLHIGPIGDGASSNGLLTIGLVATMNVLGNLWRGPIAVTGTVANLIPVIYHRSAGTVDAINSHIVGAQSRVQRRRTVGLGI